MITRKNRSLALLIASVSAAALALSACTPQDSGSGGGGEGGDLSDVQVALVPPGSHPAFQVWKDGAQAAVDEFGIGGYTFNETGEWDQTKQNAAIDSLAAQGYRAFAITGNSPTDINTTFESLKSQGFPVASITGCPAGDVNEADFCLATDVGQAAYLAAQAAIDAIGGEGTLVHLTGNAVDSNTQRRITAVEQAVEETNGAVTLLQTITDIDKDLQTAQKAVDDLLASKGSQVDAIVTTAYNPAVAATQGVAPSGLDIKVIAIDDDATVLGAIGDGDITGTVVQNLWGQSYIATWALANMQVGNCTVVEPGIVIDSGYFLVTADNLETFDDERKAKTAELLEQFQNEYLDCK